MEPLPRILAFASTVLSPDATTMSSLFWLSQVALLASLASLGAAHKRSACQAPTEDPLHGCAEGTLLVGPNNNANFSSVQSAILSLPNTTDAYTILIESGDYTEQLNITRPGPVTLLGQTDHPNDAAKNTVNVIWSNATGTPETGSYDNAYTSTLTVAPTLNASFTGAGPQGSPVAPGTPLGNRDFKAYNINFQNMYRPYSAGPALALSVSYANASFYYSQFLSYQDTVYVGKIGNTYMHSCIIGGQTDFLYGFGTLYVQDSSLLLRGCGGGITAWKGTNTTYENKYGVYVSDSRVVKANNSLDITHECALGRPWNAGMRSVFAHSYLDDSIQPNGHIEWSSTDPRIGPSKFFSHSIVSVFLQLTHLLKDTTMAEYHTYGPGFNATGRALAANVTMEWTKKEYKPYSSPAKVFQYPFVGEFGNTAWIDKHPRA